MRQRTCLLLVASLTITLSCQLKKNFLDELPDTSRFTLRTLPDFDAVLNNDSLYFTSCLPELTTTDFTIDPAIPYVNLPETERNAYTWEPAIYGSGETTDWYRLYRIVFYCNVVLEGLTKTTDTLNKAAFNRVKGRALFIRSYTYLNLAQTFAKPYNSNTAATDWGIPLRNEAAITEPIIRSTLRQTYERIIADAKQAALLLLDSLTHMKINNPTRQAAFALLARIYLTMRDYEQARLYADSALQHYSTLIDFNTVNTATSQPFPLSGDETLYTSNFQAKALSNVRAIGSTTYLVDSALYKLYAPDDLRKLIYFTNSNGLHLKQDYRANALWFFSGLTTGELFLIRAEANARAGKITETLADLNTLLTNRYKAGSFVPLTASSAAEALQLVLTERRKELCFRGLWFSDIRRLNMEGANITLTRTLNSQQHTLAPNSNRWVLPIPYEALSERVPQNPR